MQRRAEPEPGAGRLRRADRLRASEQGGAIEYLVYATGSDGREVSYVYTYTVTGDGASFTILGADGEVTCTVAADGQAECSDGTTWSASDVSGARE